MNVEELVGGMIRGALGVRGKRHRRALRALTGRRGLVTPATLLGALGVAWGLYETMKASPAAAGPAGQAAAPGRTAPPPLPVGSAPPASLREVPGVETEVARVVRLTVSAARADGTLNDSEEATILDHARRAGAEAVVEDELAQPTPLTSLVAGLPDASREQLYTLAFTIVRADETVTGAERIYLAQLAHALGLDQATVADLETRAARTIDGVAG